MDNNNGSNFSFYGDYENYDDSGNGGGAWGSSSYFESNGTIFENITTEEFLEMMLGPTRVNENTGRVRNNAT